MSRLVFFFFFQAEDGIRDLYVTGVQTCALPISVRRAAERAVVGASTRRLERQALVPRSEERRVGKECRSRWSPDHQKKKLEKSSMEVKNVDLHCRQLIKKKTKST